MIQQPLLVGRDAERAALRSCLDRVDDGFGATVLITGEPGIGKSELAAWMAVEAAQRGFVVSRGRCRELTQSPPFWLWRQVVQGLPGGQWPAAAEDGDTRFALYEGVADLLRTAALDRPVLVVLDDVHAAEAASVHLLAFLAVQLFPVRVGLVATARQPAGDGPDAAHRAEVLAEVASIRQGIRLDLGPLSVQDVREWVARTDLSDVDPVQLRDRTGGNPLFIREVLRLRDMGGSGVPDGVREAIRLRVQRLPPSTTAMLRAASVVGRDFTAPLVAAVVGVGPDAVHTALIPAVQERLVLPLGADAPGAYRFAHVLTQQVVASQIDPEERARLHARIFTVLPFVGQVEPTDRAIHAIAGAEHVSAEQALDAARRAAEDADARLAWEAARVWWRAAHEVAARDCRPLAELDALRLAHAVACRRSGDVAVARDILVAVARSRLAAGDAHSGARAVLAVGETVAEISPDAELLALLERALTLPDLDHGMRARLLARFAMATYWAPGGPQRASDLSAQAVDAARAGNDLAALAAAYVARVFCLRGPENLELRLQTGAEALAAEASGHDPGLLFRVYQWLIPDRFQAGDLSGVHEAILAAGVLADRAREPLMRWWLLVWRCLLAGFYGDDDDVLALAGQVRELGRALGQPAADTYAFAARFPVCLRAGRPEDLAAELDGLIDRFPGLATLRCNRALLLARTAQPDLARRLVHRMSASDLALIPRDALFLASVAILIETCVALDDADLVGPLLPILEPYSERNLIQGVPVAWGAAAWYLARGHQLRGEPGTAQTFARQARDLHARWGTSTWGEPVAAEDRAVRAAAPLSARETEIVALIASGRTNKEMAATLHLSVHTIERHVANIFRKIGTTNRAETAAWAHRNGRA